MSYRLILIVAALGLTVIPSIRAGDEPLPPGAVRRLGDTRFRAGGEVTDLLFSSDGTELTSRVPVDRTTTRVTVWDVATGATVRVTTEPRRPGTRARWGTTIIPDSPRGVVIDSDGVATVRDFEAGKDLVRLTGHFARVCAVTVSPDGKRLATASVDGLIRVWDTETFRPLIESRGHSAAVRGVEVSPDGRLALTTGADGTARVWDLGTGRELRAFPAHEEANPCFTPDGAAVCGIPQESRATVRDLVTGWEISSSVPRHNDPLAVVRWCLRQCGVSAALSPDGRTVAIGGRAGTVVLYETASGQARRKLPPLNGACLDLTFTPDGAKLLTAGQDHSVLVWAVRLQDTPLPVALKRETSAAKLWDRMTRGSGEPAYQATARLAADPTAAVKIARLRMMAGAPMDGLGEMRAIELLETIRTPEARALLRDLADDEPPGIRTREARVALARLGEPRRNSRDVQTIREQEP